MFVAKKIASCGKEDSVLWQGRGALPPWEHEASLGQTWCLCRGNLALVAYSFFDDDTQKRPRPHMIFRIAFVQRPRSHVRCCETGTIHLPYTSHTPHLHLTHTSLDTSHLIPFTSSLLPYLRWGIKWGLSEVSPRYLTCQKPFLQRHFKEFSEVCEVFIKNPPNSIRNRILMQNPHKHTPHHPHQTFPTVKSEFTLPKPRVYPT